jgi:hypothetical protein
MDVETRIDDLQTNEPSRTWTRTPESSLGYLPIPIPEIGIKIVYNTYRMRRFTPNTVCAGCCLWALPTMPYMELRSQG